jgi:hypothetical protein
MILDAVFTEEQSLNADFGTLFKGDKGDKGDKGEVDYTLVANALKGNANGSVIALTDISPFEHTLGVKARGEGIDVSTASIKQYKKNLLPYLYNEKIGVGGTKVSGGLTFKIREDYGVEVTANEANGYKATSDAMFSFLPKTKFPSASYILSGHPSYPSGIDKSKFRIYLLVYANDTASADYKGSTTGGDFAYTVPSGVSVSSMLYIYKDTVLPPEGLVFYPMFRLADTDGTFDSPKEPITYTPNADGTVEGVTPIFPTTTLMTDSGVVLDVEYNRDINKAFTELTNAILSLGGNI